MKLSDIYPNPKNPRLIKDEKFKKLVASIKEFPKMMELRPIIVDDKGMILGGNMRYRALLELGHKEVPDEWIKKAGELTKEEVKRFIVEDNMPFGEWDYDMLANEWEFDDLTKWGFEEAELLKDFGQDLVDDVEVDESRLFVLTVEAPEAPRLKERMAFYCENIDDYKKIQEEFKKKGSELDVNKLLEML
jgi:hypothetical protein